MAFVKNETFPAHLASVLRYHRKQSGLTRIELARLSGVGKTAIFDIEHAKHSIRLDTLFKILTVLNISLDFKSPLMQNYHQTFQD